MQPPHQGDHDVGKVLTHTLARAQRFFNRRIHFGAVRNVGEQVVNRLVQLRQQRQRIAATLATEFPGELLKRRSRVGEMTGQEHFPVIVAGDQSIKIGPVPAVDGSRRRDGLDFYRRLRGDLHQLVCSGDVEMMDRVPAEVAVLHDIGRRRDVEREIEAALFSVAARLQTDFHHAFPDGGLVAKRRGVADGIDQGFPLVDFGSFPQGLKPAPIHMVYAALKGSIFHGGPRFCLSATSEATPFLNSFPESNPQ